MNKQTLITNMSLLSYTKICELIEQGVIENSSFDMVNSASLDVTLGPDLKLERSIIDGIPAVNLGNPSTNPMSLHLSLLDGVYRMLPGEFVLGHTEQKFHLPLDISAMFMLKSTMARNGLNHHNAGWCDAGWNASSLTLEFKNDLNHHIIELSHGMKCGQIVFFRHLPVPEDRSYRVRGSYNGDQSVQSTKGLR